MTANELLLMMVESVNRWYIILPASSVMKAQYRVDDWQERL